MTKSILCLIFGILSLDGVIGCFVPGGGVVVAIFSIAFGVVSFILGAQEKKVNPNKMNQVGSILALIGMILSAVGALVSIITCIACGGCAAARAASAISSLF